MESNEYETASQIFAHKELKAEKALRRMLKLWQIRALTAPTLAGRKHARKEAEAVAHCLAYLGGSIAEIEYR